MGEYGYFLYIVDLLRLTKWCRQSPFYSAGHAYGSIVETSKESNLQTECVARPLDHETLLSTQLKYLEKDVNNNQQLQV